MTGEDEKKRRNKEYTRKKWKEKMKRKFKKIDNCRIAKKNTRRKIEGEGTPIISLPDHYLGMRNAHNKKSEIWTAVQISLFSKCERTMEHRAWGTLWPGEHIGMGEHRDGGT